MRKPPTSRHPLLYSLEHILGVFGVLAVAIGVAIYTPNTNSDNRQTDHIRPTEPTLHLASVLSSGVSLYWDGATDNVGVSSYRLYKNNTLLVSQTSPTFIDTSNLVPGSLVKYTIAAVDASGNLSDESKPAYAEVPSSSGSETSDGKEIYFSVTPAPVTDCGGGSPMHEVFFVVSNPDGGDFLLTSHEDKMEKTVSWGRQLLPNGTYSWKGVPHEGYRLSGIATDQFSLSGDCVFGTADTPSFGAVQPTTATPGSPSDTPQVVARPTLRFFVDSIPVSDTERHFSGENVELRVGTSHAKKVNFYAMKEASSSPVSLGVGVYDDLLSFKGQEVWAMTWQTRNIEAGTYRVFARVLSLGALTSESLPYSVVITQSAQTAQSPHVGVSEREEETFSLPKKREEIALRARETNPSECPSEEVCKAYCARGVLEAGNCYDFAETRISSSSIRSFPSLADGVAPIRISSLLSDSARRPKDLPGYVATPDDFVSFCKDATNEIICKRILARADLVSLDELAKRIPSIHKTTSENFRIMSERKGVRPFVDSDGDHVSDYDELNIYGIDPDAYDSDHDGFSDGEEIIMHTNPLGAASATFRSTTTPPASYRTVSEEVRLEDPRLRPGLTLPEFAVSRIEMNWDGGDVNKPIIEFSGIAPKNSAVTLFVFSDPIAVTVKANAKGEWSYVMAQNLPGGAHEAILSLSDALGHVRARSETFHFIKDEQGVLAVTVSKKPLPPSQTGAGIFAGVALILAILGIAFSVISILLHRNTLHASHLSHS